MSQVQDHVSWHEAERALQRAREREAERERQRRRPKRVRRQRTKGWRMPKNTVYVGRPSRFGNPFTGPKAANAYRRWLTNRMGRAEFNRRRDPKSWALWSDKDILRIHLPELRGKKLACWCPLDADCHADVLLELANA